MNCSEFFFQRSICQLALNCLILVAAGLGLVLTGTSCKGTCAVITRLDTEPQWVCPGADFSPLVHFRIENFDEDGDPSSDGLCLWSLWETTKAKPNLPGAIPLTKKVGKLDNPSKGVWETPPSGVYVISGTQATDYRFTLIASNDKCENEGENYLKSHQKDIEKRYGVDLDDNEVMMAHTSVEVITVGGPRELCVPHAIDVQSGFTWVKEEIRAGNGIFIEGVENPHPFSIEVKQELPPPLGTVYQILDPQGTAGAMTNAFDGRTPNGKWAIKALHSPDYDAFIQQNLKNYMGKPSICIVVGLKCQEP